MNNKYINLNESTPLYAMCPFIQPTKKIKAVEIKPSSDKDKYWKLFIYSIIYILFSSCCYFQSPPFYLFTDNC